MSRMRKVAKALPGLRYGVRLARRFHERRQAARSKPDDVFATIYRERAWPGTESASGPGSELSQTRTLVRELPRLFKVLGVSTLLDAPCGDFHWMRYVDLSSIDYIGADIVDELVAKNRLEYPRDGVTFVRLNLIRDELPQCDLILCRDCLVHLSSYEVVLALQNICHSGAEYLLTTTFPAHSVNLEIQTGEWRPLNLTIEPFRLPQPRLLINEECTELGGAYVDKSLGLWRISEIADHCRQL